MPCQDLVDSTEARIHRLVQNCNATAIAVKNEIPLLEAERLSFLLSLVDECRSAQNDAEARFQELPDDPRLRFEVLGEMIATLQRHSERLNYPFGNA
jgi:hypothetical protein